MLWSLQGLPPNEGENLGIIANGIITDEADMMNYAYYLVATWRRNKLIIISYNIIDNKQVIPWKIHLGQKRS